jgi:hypothetical protein
MAKQTDTSPSATPANSVEVALPGKEEQQVEEKKEGKGRFVKILLQRGVALLLGHFLASDGKADAEDMPKGNDQASNIDKIEKGQEEELKRAEELKQAEEELIKQSGKAKFPDAKKETPDQQEGIGLLAAQVSEADIRAKAGDITVTAEAERLAQEAQKKGSTDLSMKVDEVKKDLSEAQKKTEIDENNHRKDTATVVISEKDMSQYLKAVAGLSSIAISIEPASHASISPPSARSAGNIQEQKQSQNPGVGG